MSDAALQSDPQSVRKVREGAAAWWFWHPSVMLDTQKVPVALKTFHIQLYEILYKLLGFFKYWYNFRLMEFLEIAQRTPYILLHRFTYSFSFAQFALYFMWFLTLSPTPNFALSVCCTCTWVHSDLFPETSFAQLRFIFYNSEVFRHTFPKDKDILSCKPIGNITLIKYHYLICSSTQLLSSVPVMFFLA